jgi:hypothetical protein
MEQVGKEITVANFKAYVNTGAVRSGTVGWGTALQVGT